MNQLQHDGYSSIEEEESQRRNRSARLYANGSSSATISSSSSSTSSSSSSDPEREALLSPSDSDFSPVAHFVSQGFGSRKTGRNLRQLLGFQHQLYAVEVEGKEVRCCSFCTKERLGGSLNNELPFTFTLYVNHGHIDKYLTDHCYIEHLYSTRIHRNLISVVLVIFVYRYKKQNWICSETNLFC